MMITMTYRLLDAQQRKIMKDFIPHFPRSHDYGLDVRCAQYLPETPLFIWIQGLPLKENSNNSTHNFAPYAIHEILLYEHAIEKMKIIEIRRCLYKGL